MLDSDLAGLYGVSTKALNQAVKRNAGRFPEDFAFQLTAAELGNLRSQVVTSSSGSVDATKGSHGGRRYHPWAFTEHGAVMVASVLQSERAVEVSIYVVRAFVKLRELVGTHSALAQKLAELERQVASHDRHIRSLFDAMRQLMAPPFPNSRRTR